jgi:hypothetical protein
MRGQSLFGYSLDRGIAAVPPRLNRKKPRISREILIDNHWMDSYSSP